MHENLIAAKCAACHKRVNVSVSAKCFICPECKKHQNFGAGKINEGYKKLMKTVFGIRPDKPENN